MFVNLLSWGFLKGNSRLKLGVISDFITQSKALVGSTPQTPRADSFSSLIPCLSVFNRLRGKQSKAF
ncbi:MAG: hypothetical protein DWQ58_17625 [Microcystis aeruginosa TA09]|nr:hypothetical protein [Microcystis aeruginosa]REJ48648.1 MAG: hypothetical protein DWQ58_17625 [Microcystis aeruginosa TA09]UZO78999.1 hypothetical protein M8120_16605 [Microcystis aeruginosa str. Chao 1910]